MSWYESKRENRERDSDSQSYTSCVEYVWWEEQTRLEATVRERERRGRAKKSEFIRYDLW
jgi:hypothetical protein